MRFLCDEQRYQLKWRLGKSWSVACYRPVLLSLSCSCILNVLSLLVVLSFVGSVACYCPVVLSLSCSCIWNFLSLLVSLSLVIFVGCYHPMLSSLSCSCLWNFLSLPVSLYLVTPTGYNVLMLLYCKPHRLIVYSLVSLCIFSLHFNSFQRPLDRTR